MAKIINTYDLLEQLEKHLVEWDYTGQSGFELVDFVRGVINDYCPNCFVADEFFEHICEVSK